MDEFQVRNYESQRFRFPESWVYRKGIEQYSNHTPYRNWPSFIVCDVAG